MISENKKVNFFQSVVGFENFRSCYPGPRFTRPLAKPLILRMHAAQCDIGSFVVPINSHKLLSFMKNGSHAFEHGVLGVTGKANVERFTISLDESLAREFDELIAARGCSNRSERYAT